MYTQLQTRLLHGNTVNSYNARFQYSDECPGVQSENILKNKIHIGFQYFIIIPFFSTCAYVYDVYDFSYKTICAI